MCDTIQDESPRTSYPNTWALALVKTCRNMGLGLFIWKWFTVDVLSSLGRPIDNWHNVVSWQFPIANDTFAIFSLGMGIIGMLLAYGLGESK